MSIKVVHVNYYDNKGGAAIAVKRIHEAQTLLGIKSKTLVAVKETNSKDVIGPSTTLEEIKWKFYLSLNRKFEKIAKKKKYDSNSYNFLPNNFISKINSLDCDIVNLHWIGNNLIQIKGLSKIKKPIVWTLHDMWPYSGSEHYSLEDRYIQGYNKSNKSSDSYGLDFDRYSWELKKKYYPKDMVIIATSSWQLNTAKKSSLFKNYKIEKISLPLNFDFWKPLDKNTSRNLFKLPNNKKIILIGSVEFDKKRKGGLLIKKILKKIKTKNVIIVFFGRKNENFKLDLENFESIYLNEIKSDTIDLKTIYSASDLFIAPSIQESFGQTVLEAASCCLPTVCFENNGMNEIVKHQINGYLVKQNDLNNFAEGIDWCLENLDKLNIKNNVKIIEDKFSNFKIGSEYKKLYEEILK